VPRKIVGTSTSSISKSIHALTSSIILHKSYSAATPDHPRLLFQENYVCIVAVTPDLQRACCHCETEFFHHSSTIKLLIFQKNIKGLCLSFNVSQPSKISSSALWRLCGANSWMVATEINTLNQSDQRIFVKLVYNDLHVFGCKLADVSILQGCGW
jgi:hypothetical protein